MSTVNMSSKKWKYQLKVAIYSGNSWETLVHFKYRAEVEPTRLSRAVHRQIKDWTVRQMNNILPGKFVCLECHLRMPIKNINGCQEGECHIGSKLR